MTGLRAAIDRVLSAQSDAEKPLGIILAGHNGSGKSTMWHKHLSGRLRIPLINADRMMMSILPETDRGHLPDWAASLRDRDKSWMSVAQKGVESFVAQAMGHKVPFAMETVFSYWEEQADGTIKSKIQLIEEMQQAGYFVLLCFVGLSNVELSIARVATRVASGGHQVALNKLQDRFPRTQRAIRSALHVADAAILVDNSLDEKRAFKVCRIQLREEEAFDARNDPRTETAITEWLRIVAPRA